MGIVATLKREHRAQSHGGTPLSKPASWLLKLLGAAGTTASGIEVNEFSAMNLSAFWCAVRNISEDIAKLPVKVLRDEGDSKLELRDEPVAFLMNRQPCPECIPIAFREAMTAHALVWGNGTAEIEWYNNGRPAALWLQKPNETLIERRADGQIWYVFQSGARQGRTVALKAEDVLHIHGLGWDGVCGYSIVSKARESLGLTAAAERFGGSFFGGGAVPSGILKHPGILKPEGAERVRKSWEERHKGADKANRIAVLEEGMEYEAVGMAPEDGQFLETRQFQIPEIARWFRMPPHKLMDLLRGTFSNIEHQSIEYVVDCLTPWLIRWEQELGRKFFGVNDPRYARHNVAALLRGDTESRYRAHAIGRQWGWLSVDDVRRLEDMNPLPGEQGDSYLVPANMVPADQIAAKVEAEIEAAKKSGTVAKPPPVDPQNGNQNRMRPVLLAQRSVLAEALGRTMRVEADKLRRNSKRADFAEWAATFYAEHRDHVRAAVFPFAEAAASIASAAGITGVDAAKIALDIADRQIAEARNLLRPCGNVTAILACADVREKHNEVAADIELAELIKTIGGTQ